MLVPLLPLAGPAAAVLVLLAALLPHLLLLWRCLQEECRSVPAQAPVLEH